MSSVIDNTIEAYRVLATAQAIRLWMRAKIKPSRDMGIRDLLRIAGEYTGISYPNSRRGQAQAVEDLDNMIAGRERRLKNA